MSTKEWTLIRTVQSYDEAKDFVKSRFNVCQYRRSDLKNQTKYSFKCSEYRKYPLCFYEIKIVVPDDNMHCVTIMSRNLHEHEQNERKSTTRLPLPIRKTVANHVKCGLSQSQIKASLITNYPQHSINQDKLHNLIVYERRKDRPEIFSIYDFQNWCNEHREAKELYSTFVPFYNAVDINNVFIFFTTKQLFEQIQLTTYLQVDATFKVTWNNLPLLVFGSTDANSHFKPFGMVLISKDENTQCYVKLFNSIKTLAFQLNLQCLINQVMFDGAPAITSAQEMIFPNSRRLMCWSHMIRKCRKYRNLVTKHDWQIIDKDIHTLQLACTDDLYGHGVTLLLQKWSLVPTMKRFVDYFTEQWVSKIRHWYEGAAFAKPFTNNGLESLNGITKTKIYIT